MATPDSKPIFEINPQHPLIEKLDAEPDEDRFGELPQPVHALVRVQALRLRLRQVGARQAAARSGRVVIGPVKLDSTGMRALRDGVEGALYSTTDDLISVPAPTEPIERVDAAIAALDVLLAPVAVS